MTFRDRISRWMLETAGPLWLERGIDRDRGGFFDQLSLDRASNAANYKRVRVCARQIFVFSRFADAGVIGASAAVQHGLDYLMRFFRSGSGGYVARIDLQGAVLDATEDLYDQAFVLFALAAAARHSNREFLLQEALALVDYVQRRFRHPAGGFNEALPPRWPRRQNPHMHLLEACLAWIEAGVDKPFASLAGELVRLAETRFWRAELDCLVEYFDDKLDLMPPSECHFEPGHHFEWIVLLGRAAELGIGDAESSLPVALARSALSRGFAGKDCPPWGEVRADGTVANHECRIWQICEWLRAATLYPGLVGSNVLPGRLLESFLDVEISGLWRERCESSTMRFREEPVPASSLYHIVTGCEPLVFAEVRPANVAAKLCDGHAGSNSLSHRRQ